MNKIEQLYWDRFDVITGEIQKLRDKGGFGFPRSNGEQRVNNSNATLDQMKRLNNLTALGREIQSSNLGVEEEARRILAI